MLGTSDVDQNRLPPGKEDDLSEAMMPGKGRVGGGEMK
jgi:hypothetical protein